MNRAEEVVAAARTAGATIVTAESCTGGLIAGAITDVPGSSEVFDRGFVTYSNAAKLEMLKVNEQSLGRHGAVSEVVAREMAEGALSRSSATLAVAVTGVAGPGGSEQKPEGRVCFAVARREAPTRSETVEFGAIGRGSVRRASVDRALGLLLEELSQS